MEESFGKVLKRAIDHEEKEEQKSRQIKNPLFANPTRQKIFQYLCKRPCSHLRQIARDLNIAVPTAEWHLKKFMEKDILKTVISYNKHIYYPANMIDTEDIKIIWALNNEKSRNIYEVILDNPGITQKKICEKSKLYQQAVSCYTAQLEEAGLIKSQRVGRQKRYTITKHPKEILRSSQQRRKLFRDGVLKILKEEGLKPKVLRLRDWEMTIQINDHGKTSVMSVNSNPLSGLV